MAKLKWDEDGKRFYETGVKNVALFVKDGDTYGKGVAWNGVTQISENPSGAEFTALYADDIKYLNLQSKEEFGATIEAYTYPEEFAACDGSVSIAKGAYIGQQPRKSFGLAYITTVGNDSDGTAKGKKLHIVYNCMASPSEKAYSTINDSPEAITFSWELTTTPVEVTGHEPTAIITVDSTKTTGTKFDDLCDYVFGSGSSEGTDDAAFPTPAKVMEILGQG